MANNTIIPKKTVQIGKVPSQADLALGEIAINHADAKIYSRNPSTGEVYELTGGGGGGPVGTAVDLDAMFSTAFENYHHEVNYSGSGDITDIQVYDDNLQTTHLFSRTFTYDGSGNLTQIVTSDEQNAGVSLTKTISYNGSGDIASVTRNYVL
jgi:YD repeat-containing protein